MDRTVILGLDLGQRRDPTALAVVESVPEQTGRTVHIDHEPPWGECKSCYPAMEDAFYCRDVARLPLNMRYREQAEHVAEVVGGLNERGVKPYLLVDATGGGIPAAEEIEAALADVDCYLSNVTFTSGEGKPRGALGSASVSMPKTYLAQRVQSLLQSGRLRLPDTERHRALAEELRTYEVRVTESNRRVGLVAGAFKMGTHDDMATALGLACLFDPSGASGDCPRFG